LSLIEWRINLSCWSRFLMRWTNVVRSRNGWIHFWGKPIIIERRKRHRQIVRFRDGSRQVSGLVSLIYGVSRFSQLVHNATSWIPLNRGWWGLSWQTNYSFTFWKGLCVIRGEIKSGSPVDSHSKNFSGADLPISVAHSWIMMYISCRHRQDRPCFDRSTSGHLSFRCDGIPSRVTDCRVVCSYNSIITSHLVWPIVDASHEKKFPGIPPGRRNMAEETNQWLSIFRVEVIQLLKVHNGEWNTVKYLIACGVTHWMERMADIQFVIW
jgi:hypothetical protein